MPPVYAPITEYVFVQYIMRLCQQASREAYNTVWLNLKEFNNAIIRLGVFFLICAYMRAVWKSL